MTNMRQLLFTVRVGGAALLLIYIAVILFGARQTVHAVFIALIIFCQFADASISLAYPQLAKQPTEGSSIVGSLYQASFFYDAKATKGYTATMAVLFGVLLIAAIAKLLRYW